MVETKDDSEKKPRKKTISQNDPELFGGRIPPQDIEAERSLLGAILLDDSAFPDILEKIKPIDFYEKKHGAIYRGMMSLYEHNQPIDLLTLTSELRNLKLLKDIGGASYLTELTNVVPTAAHVLSYSKLVEQASIRRRLIRAGTEITNQAYDSTTDVSAMLGAAEKELFAVSDQTTKTEYAALEDLLVDAFDRMEALHTNKGSMRGLKTGFRDLDNKTAGFQRGDLIIIGARPAMGKTTFAQNLAYNIAGISAASSSSLWRWQKMRLLTV